MTDQEAIEIINNVNWEEYDRSYCLMKPARDMAIKSLEAQIKLKECIANLDNPEFAHLTWSHEEVLKLLKEHIA